MAPCKHCHGDSCIYKVPIFAGLDESKVGQLERLVQQREYRSGEIIYLEDEPDEFIYIIDSGLVKLYTIGKDGGEYILRLLKSGDFFGEFVFFREAKHGSSAETVTDCKICMIGKKELENLLRTDTELSFNLLASITDRLNETEQKLISLALEDAREKTMRLLLDLAQESGEKRADGILVKLPLNRQGLANLIGLSQETLSRKLSELEKENIITLQGQKQVLLRKK